MRPLLALLLCACGSPTSSEPDLLEPLDAAPDVAGLRDMARPADVPRDAVAVLDTAPADGTVVEDMTAPADMAQAPDLVPEADLNPGPHSLAGSAFSVDSEGWSAIKIIAPAPRSSPGVPIVSTWHPSAGNGDDGCLYTEETGAEAYWQAPAKFLGNKSAAYGGSLVFSLKAVTLPRYDQDVILVGGGMVAVRQLEKYSVKAWQIYNVPLYAGAWHKDTDAGDLLTEQDLRAVLGNLTMLRIHAGLIGVGVNQAAWLDSVAIYRQ